MASLTIKGVERGWELRAEQWFRQSVEELFPFFAEAGNLGRITPPYLGWRILTPQPIEMREGALIDYRIRLRVVPIRWRTRIAEWDPPRAFTDEQVRGPYRWWVHRHIFEPRDGGTLMTDLVRYGVPGGPLAPLVHRLAVRRDLRRIFAYRQDALEEIFGDAAATEPVAPGAEAA